MYIKREEFQMHYPDQPYEPDEDSIAIQKELLKQQRIQKLQCKNPAKKIYQRGVTKVVSDTRPVVGTQYQ